MPQICVQSLVYFVVFAAFSRHMLLLHLCYCHVTGMEPCDWLISFSRLLVTSHLWLMAYFWSTRLTLNVILGPFQCKSRVPSEQNK